MVLLVNCKGNITRCQDGSISRLLFSSFLDIEVLYFDGYFEHKTVTYFDAIFNTFSFTCCESGWQFIIQLPNESEEVQVVSADRSDLDAFPRCDEVDVFWHLCRHSHLDIAGVLLCVLPCSLALKTSSISFFSSFNLSDARLNFIKR